MTARDDVPSDTAGSGEACGDEPLARYLARVGRLPVLQGLALAAQLLAALDALHRLGLVHGGIGSAQLLVSRSGQLKLPDPAAPPHAFDTAPAARDARDVQAAQRADLFAAAIVTYELLAGAAPFEPGALASDAVDGDPGPRDSRSPVPRSVREHRAELPAALDGVFHRALAASPAERYETAADLSAALQAALPPPHWTRPPAARPAQSAQAPAIVAAEPAAPDTAARARLRRQASTTWSRRVGLPLAIACAMAVFTAVAWTGWSLSGGSSQVAGDEAAVARPMVDAPGRESMGRDLPVKLVAPVQRDAPAQREAPLQHDAPGQRDASVERGSSVEHEARVPREPALERIGPVAGDAAVATSAGRPPSVTSTGTPGTSDASAHPDESRRDRGMDTAASMRADADAHAPRAGPAPQLQHQGDRKRRTRLAAVERRPSHGGRPASPDPEAACREDLAIAPGLCTAFRCATAEFRDHPVCVRLHAEGARARARLAESRGGP